jgi:hypothetical protein
MVGARVGFGAGESLFSQLDFRLIPELDPFIVERLVEVNAQGHRRRQSELELLQDLDDRLGLERLLEHRQHVELVLKADALDVIEYRGAAVAHELDRPAIFVFRKEDDRLDGVGGFK